MTKIVLVDDYRMIRKLLRGLLEAEPGIEVVGEADDGCEGLRIAGERQPDVVICDLRMQGMDGLELTRELRGHFQEVRIIILSMHGDPVYVTQAMDAGALGYVLKGGDFEELIQAIHQVSSGQRYLSPSLAAGKAKNLHS